MFASNAQHLPADLQQSLNLALHYQQGGQMKQAEALYRQALSLYPGHPLVLHHLAALLLHSAQAAAAVPLLEQARKVEPDNGAHVLLLAEALLILDRPKEAKKLLTHAIRQGLRHPRADALLEQARTGRSPSQAADVTSKAEAANLEQLLRAGKHAEVVERARAFVQRYPTHAQAWRCLGLAALALGRHEDAAQALGRSVQIKPGLAETHYYLGYALEQSGRMEAAAQAYAEAARLKPDMYMAHNNLGNVLLRLQRAEEALAAYCRAQALRPDLAELSLNVADALRTLGRQEDAINAYRAAIRLKPDLAEAYSGLGFVLSNLERYDEALDACRRALALRPEDMGYHNNMGIVLRKLKRTAEAAETFSHVLRHVNGDAAIYRNYALALEDLGKIPEAFAAYRRSLELDPNDLETRAGLVFLLNYLEGVPPSEVLAEAMVYGRMLEQSAPPQPGHNNVVDPERTLRVGLVSGDLGAHSVGFFLEAVLAQIDPKEIELYAYETAKRNDEVNARLRQHVGNWRDAGEKLLDDDALTQLIREDGIDILVDLNGYTAHGRLPVFARKPAPVQVSWLGYLGTTGLKAIDYVLADPWALPVGEESQFTETPWRLPETYICFTPPPIDLEVGPLPALANGHVTFGCFNNLAKVTDRVIACWARILHAVPGSRLYVKNKQLSAADTRTTVAARFVRHGITADRLIMEGQLATREEHLRAHQRIDIALDPFPYPGITTTVEALWMGVATLTLRGDRFIRHQGETILHNAGLPDWIAADEDDYVAKAVTYAADLEALAALRAQLRPRLLASPLCDAPRFARHLEQAFRQMWRIWCAGHTGQRPITQGIPLSSDIQPADEGQC
jgi:predicted O-linked N-acetylglucosamine transferase (SPINDLY family)